jgi:hypothetical protein
MSQLVCRRGEFFRLGLARKQRDLPAARYAARGCDLFGILHRYSLRARELVKTLGILTQVAMHGADLRQFLAIGLADVLYRESGVCHEFSSKVPQVSNLVCIRWRRLVGANSDVP